MKRRQAIIGLCVLCSLAMSGLAAQGAAAATKGTTAFTCVKRVDGVPKAEFPLEHCKLEGGVPEYGHVAFAENTTTEVSVTNAKTNSITKAAILPKFKSSIGAMAIEIVATSVASLSGSMKNKMAAGGEHFVHVENLVLEFTGVTEELLKCEVLGLPGATKGVVKTTALTATTAGEEHNIKVEPENAQKLFAEFELKNCKGLGNVGVIKVFGDTTGEVNGATISFKHATGTGEPPAVPVTMRIGNPTTGKPAGIESTVTGSGKDPSIIGDTLKTLSATTVETP